VVTRVWVASGAESFSHRKLETAPTLRRRGIYRWWVGIFRVVEVEEDSTRAPSLGRPFTVSDGCGPRSWLLGAIIESGWRGETDDQITDCPPTCVRRLGGAKSSVDLRQAGVRLELAEHAIEPGGVHFVLLELSVSVRYGLDRFEAWQILGCDDGRFDAAVARCG
jgi:hypothetical protein